MHPSLFLLVTFYRSFSPALGAVTSIHHRGESTGAVSYTTTAIHWNKTLMKCYLLASLITLVARILLLVVYNYHYVSIIILPTH